MSAARVSRLSRRLALVLAGLFLLAMGTTFGRDAIAAVVTKGRLLTGSVVSGATANRLLKTDASGNLADSEVSDDGTSVTVNIRLHATGAFHAQTSLALGAHVVVVASNGTGVENVETLNGQRSLFLVDCNDADGCALHLGTTNVEPGALVRIVSISNNTLLLSTGVGHIAGAAFNMGVNDVITLQVVRNRSGALYAVEIDRSNN